MEVLSIIGKRPPRRGAHTVLGRLAQDTGGNVIAIMAAALIPFCGMVGGAVDLSRMYLTKTRLQHACDAGVLAGRKRMGSGSWTANGGAANAAALSYFNANYDSTGMYGGNAPTVAFAENAGKVTGTASAVVPMTLMRVLGFEQETLSVACDAEMRLPNTDIMFVLDTTGSMGAPAVPTDTVTKMESLRTAVKCFFEIVARLDSDATCVAGSPDGGTGSQVQIRFGFMPYSMNVNVGRLLPTSYFADTWTYQSREPLWTTTTTETWTQQSQTSRTEPAAYTNVPSSYCTQAQATALDSSTDTFSSDNNTRTNTSTVHTRTGWTDSNGGTCSGTRQTTTTVFTRTVTTSQTFDRWRYRPVPTTVAGLKNGTTWNRSITVPIGANGTPQTVTWDGCIEERPTVPQASFATIPSGAHDLNIDLVPSPGTPSSLWGPALKGLIYSRNITTNFNQAAMAPIDTTDNYWNGNPYGCPTEARKLQTWTNANAFDDYVDSLTPVGNTYHDIGMLWGARFVSPTGIFASENAFTPQGGEIERHLIFMTDGDAVSTPCDYTAYGVAWWDQRTTTDVGPPEQCGTARNKLADQVNARLDGLCTAVKNKNITLWVISFGTGSNTATETRLEQCATSGRYFTARDSATLQATFASIANQISQLRLTR